MSWISDIAGKAENFLNQIDQNAATAIESAKLASSTAGGGPPRPGGEPGDRADDGGDHNVSAYPFGPPVANGGSGASGSVRNARNKDRDSELLEVSRLHPEPRH